MVAKKQILIWLRLYRINRALLFVAQFDIAGGIHKLSLGAELVRDRVLLLITLAGFCRSLRLGFLLLVGCSSSVILIFWYESSHPLANQFVG